eukprot:CAMPEP_0169477018 /NCGR_PEP_ID=MMETSP1042-20121227/27686_1 /TAXON_ID=464988 /ORGANISM="Hemiselmis andersenii, Strain CCMP1180" /LENGTH=187 /DNA_ID=CAMNT_0009591327 /DNA_START=150 /DNA_END=713 /DNA_ORIENTATION=-
MEDPPLLKRWVKLAAPWVMGDVAGKVREKSCHKHSSSPSEIDPKLPAIDLSSFSAAVWNFVGPDAPCSGDPAVTSRSTRRIRQTTMVGCRRPALRAGGMVEETVLTRSHSAWGEMVRRVHASATAASVASHMPVQTLEGSFFSTSLSHTASFIERVTERATLSPPPSKQFEKAPRKPLNTSSPSLCL